MKIQQTRVTHRRTEIREPKKLPGSGRDERNMEPTTGAGPRGVGSLVGPVARRKTIYYLPHELTRPEVSNRLVNDNFA